MCKHNIYKHGSFKALLKSYNRYTKYKESCSLSSNIAFNFAPLDFYVWTILKKVDISNKY